MRFCQVSTPAHSSAFSNRRLPAIQENADCGHNQGEPDDDQRADLMAALPIRLPVRVGISTMSRPCQSIMIGSSQKGAPRGAGT